MFNSICDSIILFNVTFSISVVLLGKKIPVIGYKRGPYFPFIIIGINCLK
jgi:hypothetical protein